MHRSIGRRSVVVAAGLVLLSALTPMKTSFARQQAAPAPRALGAMAYDSSRGQTVLFGGHYHGDTWIWDGTSWSHRHPDHTPPTDASTAMAYDAARGVVVLLDYQHRTWTWDGTDWRKLAPEHHPPGLYNQGMAYDAARQQVVLFGGGDPNPVGDTWTWDGTDWTKQAPAHAPSARLAPGMAYDAARGVVVLFGGADQGIFGDTWTWDGTDWTERSPVHTPSPRWYSNMAFDPAAGRVVLFGGVVGGDYLGDTWTWNGSDWTQRTPAHSPPARWAAPTATNASGDGVVVFGGAGHPPDLLLADTWTWNGTDWTAQTAASIGLSRRSGPAGESIDVAGWGYLPGEQVKLTFSDSVIGGVKLKRVTTDASGAFHAKVRVPAGATPGKQVIRAVGNSSGDIAKQGFTVT